MEDAEKIIEKLGGLPLAITQAAAYMSKGQMGFSRYLHRFETNFKRVASKAPTVTTYRNDTVFTCWEMSFKALTATAARLLHLCAFLSHEDIPDEIFRRGKRAIDWLSRGTFD